MQNQPTSHPKKMRLILVLDHDEQIGRQVVQIIRQETAFQAILATTLTEAHVVLEHLKCDLMVLTDDAFPDEDLERLYLLPEEVEPPELVSLTMLSGFDHARGIGEVRSIVKAMQMLLAVRGGQSLSPLSYASGRKTLSCGGTRLLEKRASRRNNRAPSL